MSPSEGYSISTEVVDYDDIVRVKTIRDMFSELETMPLYFHKEVQIKNIPTTGNAFYNIKEFIEKQNINTNNFCKIFSGKPPVVKIKPKANPRPFNSWVVVELEMLNVPIRIAATSTAMKYGVLINDGWIYFRSFGNVLKNVKSVKR